VAYENSLLTANRFDESRRHAHETDLTSYEGLERGVTVLPP